MSIEVLLGLMVFLTAFIVAVGVWRSNRPYTTKRKAPKAVVYRLPSMFYKGVYGASTSVDVPTQRHWLE